MLEDIGVLSTFLPIILMMLAKICILFVKILTLRAACLHVGLSVRPGVPALVVCPQLRLLLVPCWWEPSQKHCSSGAWFANIAGFFL